MGYINYFSNDMMRLVNWSYYVIVEVIDVVYGFFIFDYLFIIFLFFLYIFRNSVYF